MSDEPKWSMADRDQIVPDPIGWNERSRRALALEALLDIAYDASSYLRRHAKPAVRVAAALLLAGSLAACSGGPSGVLGSSIVAPLQQEIRQGLPTVPGRYAVVDGSLGRDGRGVYYFAWRRPNDPSTVRNLASVSRLRLGQAASNALEIPTSGDPTLYLQPSTSIPLVDQNEFYQTGGYYSGYHSYWHPWYSGGYRGVGYYDPPARSYSGNDVNGSTMSSSPRSFAERTVGLAHAVSGRSGGTGSGTAATAKSGASFATSTLSHGAPPRRSRDLSRRDAVGRPTDRAVEPRRALRDWRRSKTRASRSPKSTPRRTAEAALAPGAPASDAERPRAPGGDTRIRAAGAQ